MLSSFDWLRRCRTGAELLATLRLLETTPDLFPPSDAGTEEIGPPFSALDSPCKRCWIYPRQDSPRRLLCSTCLEIISSAAQQYHFARSAIVIWGGVDELPRRLVNRTGFYANTLGLHIVDDHHFLMMVPRWDLKPWLQELALYHGMSLRGLIQVLPVSGGKQLTSMGEVLCRAVHHEGRFTLDRLWIRFFSAPHQLLAPHTRDQMGMLTFEITDFLSLLEMASVFRTLLFPNEQDTLRQLLELEDHQEQQFYWGRFTGQLDPKAKDMLNAWGVRQWPKERIKLLYELADYVAFYTTD
ncbi:MAG TPA: hypothetical protein ENF52_06985 [Chloroflexi bacterium]|nr:hypothetical protein [Chloroflexota bacterium]